MKKRFVALIVLFVYALTTPRALQVAPPRGEAPAIGALFPFPAVTLEGDTVMITPARDRPTVIAMFPESMIERRRVFYTMLDSLRRYPVDSVAVVILMAPGIAAPEAARQKQDTSFLYLYDQFGIIPRVGNRKHPTLIVADSAGVIHQILVVPTS